MLSQALVLFAASNTWLDGEVSDVQRDYVTCLVLIAGMRQAGTRTQFNF